MAPGQIPKNSSSFSFPAPGASLRLTTEEWELIVSALSAYQHNQTYRPLYEKLAAQTA